jgi:N-acetylmuramoyl-L-alanine amidase
MAKVFINPGHDELSLKGTPDYDCGAVNYDLPLYENEVALAVGELVQKYLIKAGCDVELLQSESLSDICEAANSWCADLFVSIHCNAFNEIANGVETLTYPSDIEGYHLAECIQNQILGTFEDLTDRGLKARTDLAVLNGTDMPAVLVEMAFIDNPDDAILLRDRQDDFARAIARGVTDYLSGC